MLVSAAHWLDLEAVLVDRVDKSEVLLLAAPVHATVQMRQRQQQRQQQYGRQERIRWDEVAAPRTLPFEDANAARGPAIPTAPRAPHGSRMSFGVDSDEPTKWSWAHPLLVVLVVLVSVVVVEVVVGIDVVDVPYSLVPCWRKRFA
jgi:hypothetical protein